MSTDDTTETVTIELTQATYDELADYHESGESHDAFLSRLLREAKTLSAPLVLELDPDELQSAVDDAIRESEVYVEVAESDEINFRMEPAEVADLTAQRIRDHIAARVMGA